MVVIMGQGCKWQTPADTVKEYSLFKGQNVETERNHYKKQERTQHGLGRNVASQIFQSFPQGCWLWIIVPTGSEKSAIYEKPDLPFSGGFYYPVGLFLLILGILAPSLPTRCK